VLVVQPSDAGFGVMLPSFDPFRRGRAPVVEGAVLAEELGFDSGWVGDHLSFHPPLLDALTALTAALGALHPDEMSPREALEALYALKAQLAKTRRE